MEILKLWLWLALCCGLVNLKNLGEVSRTAGWASRGVCLLSWFSESGVVVAAARVVVEAAANVVAVVVGRGVSSAGVVVWSLTPHVKETSGPGMIYLVGLRKTLMVMPGSALLYQFVGEDPPTSSWVPSPLTSRLMQ